MHAGSTLWIAILDDNVISCQPIFPSVISAVAVILAGQMTVGISCKISEIAAFFPPLREKIVVFEPIIAWLWV